MPIIQQIPILTATLIGCIILISYQGFRDESFFQKYKFEIEAILGRKQYYRLLSSAFLHADIGHLLLNLFCFYSFAENIEFLFGKKIVLAIFFLSLLGGSVLSLLFHRNHYDYSAVGASGAVSGIIFASIFLLPGGKVGSFWLPIEIPASIFAILYVIASMYGIKAQHDNIGHEAHLGGAITGMLFAFAVYPQMVLASLWQFIVIMALIVGFLVYCGRNFLFDSLKSFRAANKNLVQVTNERMWQQLQGELDRLLEKVSSGGLKGLSKDERERLQRISQEMQRQ